MSLQVFLTLDTFRYQYTRYAYKKDKVFINKRKIKMDKFIKENMSLKRRLNYIFGPRILTSSRKSCFFALLILPPIFNSKNTEK